MKFLKVMFGTTSGANSGLEYKLNEVNVANNWNPTAENGRDFGGFNYSSEDCILRWLHRGDTVYDVIIPDDAENIKLEGATTIYRCNKIILTNPRKVTDEMAMEFYKKSNIPEKSYYKAMGAVALMNYKNTALAILRNKVNKDNIDLVLDEWNNFMNHGGDGTRIESNETVVMIDEMLNEIKSDLLVSINVNKEPYIKDITSDNIINITGESGSGKSTYANKYLNDDNYIVIDTDELKGNRPTDNKNSLEFRAYLVNKYEENIPDICADFNIIYKEILDYYKNTDKTLVIDSAQYRNLRTEEDLRLLKGKIIIIRTPIDTCYERCVNRWKNIMKNYSEDDLEKYKAKKKNMYSWYRYLNDFIKNVNEL